jgi:hypothetical protein
MGSYAECTVENLHVGTSKNGVDRFLVGLFRETDHVTCEATSPTLPRVVAERWEAECDESEEPFNVSYYCAPVGVIKDRLELQGYTLATAKKLFDISVAMEIEQLQGYEYTHAELREYRQSKIRQLRSLNVDLWLTKLREIYDSGLRPWDKSKPEDAQLRQMLESSEQEGWYGYEGPDMLVALRLAMEICPPDAEVVYDVTDLVLQGYFSIDEEIVERTLAESAQEFTSSGRIVVLTEGRTDNWILKESMQLLYPHLLEYFSFMDFDSFRVGGGAGQLANLVKAFSAAGIVNRVIAVFDNDTASCAAMQWLNRAQLPKHIAPLKLPDHDALRAYPTLGPAGLTAMDINGMAASIELYCGDDILRDDLGNLAPVQWTGWEPTIRQYQGEIVNKAEVHQRFRKKLELCREDPSLLAQTDWTGIRLILTKLLSAFHSLDEEAHSHFLLVHYGRESEVA